MLDPQKVDELIKAANKNGKDNTNAVNDLISKLSEEDKKRLSAVLDDKTKLEQLMKSPQAQALLRRFGGK